jgi:hypothetical protein
VIPIDPLFHKPKSIIAAKNILYASIFLGIIIIAINEMTTGFRNYSNTQVLVTCFLILAMIFLLTKLIGAGKKWARVAFLVLFIGGLIFIPFGLVPLFNSNIIIEVLFIFQGMLQILALIFLFTQKSTSWFDGVRSSHPQ